VGLAAPRGVTGLPRPAHGHLPPGRIPPGIRHLANSIFTQLAMAASGLGVTLVPNVSVRQIQPAAPYRPLTDRADIVELSLVSRDGAHEPLTEHFLRIATQ
jgi:DNA-binding transcriptional LysR family regulator